jgi:large subunit ribosomal protein L1
MFLAHYVEDKQKMELNEQLKNALVELRKEKDRKFDQTLDLIINLQKFDTKKESINLFVSIPHKIKDKKVAGFLEVKNSKLETITPNDFKKYEDKRALKKLVNQFDFFIAQASLMPKVATIFGRVLGPAGKMPSPQLGIVADINDKVVDELKKKVNNGLKIKTKEPSIKISIGKKSMKDEDIIDNINTVYTALLKVLTKGNDNIKNIELKFTMTKPIKIKIK